MHDASWVCFVKKSRWNWLLICLFLGKLSILNCFTRVTMFWFMLLCFGDLLYTFTASLRKRRNQWKCWSRVLQACVLTQSDILFGLSWSLLEIFDWPVILLYPQHRYIWISKFSVFWIYLFIFWLDFWTSHLNVHSNWQKWLFSKCQTSKFPILLNCLI